MITFRSATAADKQSILKIYEEVVGIETTLDDAQWFDLLRANGLIVAASDGCLVGFGAIDVKSTEQLEWLYLLPEHQGRGIGSEILYRLEQLAWQAGLNSVRLHSAPDAVEFYRRHGYREIQASEEPGHDHPGVEMAKERNQTVK
jgi:GNAT superfamily N-acetyltransferase